MADPGRSAWIARVKSTFRRFSVSSRNATLHQGHLAATANDTCIQAKLAMMDRHGIDVTLLSTNFPGPELFGADGPAIAHMMNDCVAGIARRHPQRFASLAVLPAQKFEESMKELDRAVCELGMQGCCCSRTRTDASTTNLNPAR